LCLICSPLKLIYAIKKDTVEECGGKFMGCGCGGKKRIITDLKQLQLNQKQRQMIKKLGKYRQVNNTNTDKKENKEEQ
jgi:hypothetical protein